MTSIGISRTSSELTLHTCAACGQHVWQSYGKHLNREAVLESLRHAPAPEPSIRRRPRTRRTPPEPVAPATEAVRPAELQRLLGDFRVHGTSS